MQMGSIQSRAVRYAIFALCAGVLLFAAKSKISQYGSMSPQSPVVSARVWFDGEKMEPRTITPVLALAFWIAATVTVLITPVRLRPEPDPAPRRARLFELHRFLRPPPSV